MAQTECSCLLAACSIYIILVGVILLTSNIDTSHEYKIGVILILIGTVCILINLFSIARFMDNNVRHIENEQFEMIYVEHNELPDDEDNISTNSIISISSTSSNLSTEFIKIDID
jgi:hypothetical protein